MAYTNSPLVTYTKISPNKTINRNHKIDTIVIHCMAGNLTIEQCGTTFSNVIRQASSNYGVGTDGRIGMYVEEKDRSWATSSAKVDNRAITIEVANDGGSPDWHVSDKALASLIMLCADICKRNGIAKLVWSTSKYNRINHLNGCNMEVHRDHSTKTCPGNYLYSKHGYIASEVNKILNGNIITPESQISQNTPPLSCTATKKGVQEYLNKYYEKQIKSVLGANLTVDGSFGEKSKKGLAIAYQTELNRLGAELKIDGSFGPSSETAYNKYVGNIKSGSKGIFVTIWQCLLVGFGYSISIDGSYGTQTKNTTNILFKNKGLAQDYVVDGSDLNKLL